MMMFYLSALPNPDDEQKFVEFYDKYKYLIEKIAIVLAFSFSVPSFALYDLNNDTDSSVKETQIAENIKSISAKEAKNMTISELGYAAKLATTDEEATIIFDALVEKYNSLGVAKAASSSLISNYLSVTSVSKSGSTVSIKYSIIAKVPSGSTLVLGYEFPSAIRVSAQTINLSAKSKGSYTANLTVPNYMCQSRVFAKFTARNYNESKVYKTFNYSSSKKVDYRTITAAEAVGSAVISILPGVVLTLVPETKLAKFVGKALTIGGATFTVINATTVTLGPPSPKAGQYYKTEMWYSNNKVYTTLTVWQSKSSYTRGDTPIYQSSVSINAKLPTF